MQLKLDISPACLLGLALVLTLFGSVRAGTVSGITQATSAKELKNNFKVMLTKLKLRHVPVAKKRSESELQRLYQEKRKLEEEINQLEVILRRISGNAGRQLLQVMESGLNSRLASRKMKSPNLKISEMTKERAEEVKRDLAAKKSRYEIVGNKIFKNERIIKDPESFISVPSDYGLDPEAAREREKEVLIKDRLNSEFRAKVTSGELQPTWIVDEW